ncbi:hypothetical protein [Tropicimonas sp. IMCC34011]|uniref:hypothetical protein n=1 Tax=Tropicimonas sp. IMCC34011 TaxID=2248759 RepID=UPI0018E55C75|nr:hypothetical protein [Tropicimonas sp. IMCC34011]
MKLWLLKALRDDTGAVTVDWVVLTGAIIVMSIGAAILVTSGVSPFITKIAGLLAGG